MLSFPHLVVIFVVALVIFGPQKLPELARMLGKATAEFRKMTSDFRYALEDEVRELERQTRLREAETSTVLTQAQPAAPPASETPATEATTQPENALPAHAESPSPAVHAGSVTSPPEKPSDEHAAV